MCQIPWTVYYAWIKNCNTVIKMGAGNPTEAHTDALLNSIPDFSVATHKSRLNALPGVIPPLQHLPIGCRLGPRCPYAQRLCIQTP